MMIYTVAGYVIEECPIDLLKKEAEADRALKASGVTNSGNWQKLAEVEKQINHLEHCNLHH